MVVAGIAAMLALLSLAVSVVAYRQTADLAEAGPVQPPAGGGITAPVQADLDAITARLDRLAALVATNAAQYASLQQELAAAPMPDAPSIYRMHRIRRIIIWHHPLVGWIQPCWMM